MALNILSSMSDFDICRPNSPTLIGTVCSPICSASGALCGNGDASDRPADIVLILIRQPRRLRNGWVSASGEAGQGDTPGFRKSGGRALPSSRWPRFCCPPLPGRHRVAAGHHRAGRWSRRFRQRPVSLRHRVRPSMPCQPAPFQPRPPRAWWHPVQVNDGEPGLAKGWFAWCGRPSSPHVPRRRSRCRRITMRLQN